MSSNPILPFLNQNGFMVLDGALATELERRGADLNHPLWSAKLLVEAPDLIRAVHHDYFMAGADVAITASYQATLQGFAQQGIGRDAGAALLRRSVHVAKEARDEYWAVPSNRVGRQRPLVAASIGPYGAYLADGSEYRGSYGLTVNELIDFHRERLEILATSGADLLALETIPCLDEAHALIQLVNKHKVWAWMAFSCCDEEHICQGELFRTAVALAEQSPWIVAVGINCTAPSLIRPLLECASVATSKPFVVYPNRGDRWDVEGRRWLENPDEPEIVAIAPKWCEAGAQLIGGCCRTRPDIIRSLSATLRVSASGRM